MAAYGGRHFVNLANRKHKLTANGSVFALTLVNVNFIEKMFIHCPHISIILPRPSILHLLCHPCLHICFHNTAYDYSGLRITFKIDKNEIVII